ncbi:glycosyltransferase [Gracilibacillus phocaeensis]|uniref:glycosyltransferase n=1 Tax=Gracilibacillus phocaeensis TaxID=2042304 RepID=UPI0010322D05|nr:glycosyltransferase family 2 protein [Gracilibacillus phocaeensis]
MMQISLCMIVKNEEEVLRQCLDSVAPICDEVIIVDTGSTDKTKEIAQDFTEQVIDFEWIDDFSAARNFAFSQAHGDYILWLDADDMLEKEDQEKLRQLKAELDGTEDAVSMLYHIAFDEYNTPTFSYRRNRLVKREKNFQWIGPVHEYLEVYGHIISSDIAVAHRKSDKTKDSVPKDRNLKIYEKRLKQGEKFSPRDLFYYANELKDHRLFQKAAIYYREFLATKKGWIEDEIRACINMAACYRSLGNPEKEIESLVMSITYDVPRPEVSCRIGDLYKEKNKFEKAIIWYRLAVDVDISDSQGFYQQSYATWYPHLQLCVCYWQIGDQDRAIEHNSKAKTYRPQDTQVLYNEKFFKEYAKKNQ